MKNLHAWSSNYAKQITGPIMRPEPPDQCHCSQTLERGPTLVETQAPSA